MSKNSLIKDVKIESLSGLPKSKIIFTVVNDKKLAYYTNSDKFLESLNKVIEKSIGTKGFLIEYELADYPKTLDENYKKDDETVINKVKFTK